MTAKEGVPDLEQVFRKYGDFVYRTCYRYFRNPRDAEDLAQEVFVKLHSRLPGYRGEASLSTWIYRIAANCCIDALRTRRNHVPFDETGLDVIVERNLNGHGDSVLARIDLDRILAQTDEKTREILFLSLAEGCSHEEVGEVVGMTRWAITKTIGRFQKKLQAGKKAWLVELFERKVA